MAKIVKNGARSAPKSEPEVIAAKKGSKLPSSPALATVPSVAIAPKKGAKKGEKGAAPAPVAPTAERKAIPLTAKITVVASANPKRPGTKAAAKWPLYVGCKTVADLVKVFVAKGYPKRRAFSALRWDSGRGFIKLG